MNSAVAVLCLCLLAASANAFQVSFGSCPKDVKVVQNFDAAAYMGHWYEIEAFSQIWELGGKCSVADYALRDDGKVSVKNSMRFIVGNEVSQEGYAEVTSDDGAAELLVTFDVPIVGKRQANYLVLNTDYTNYSLVYSCSNLFGGLKIESAWILGRDKSFSEEVQQQVEEDIKAAGLKRRAFRPTKQDC